MKTGSQGTFVISWTQTEVDGLASAARGALGIGSAWRWCGTAVRVDGPQQLLLLQGADGEADVRARVARKVNKLFGRLIGSAQAGAGNSPDYDDPVLQLGFDVTDGFRAYTVTLVELGAGAAPLLMFSGAIPPTDTDLWVVRAQMEVAEVNRMSEQPTGVICFTPGTRIRTDRGDVAVEEIAEGDRVQTKDNGMQEVLWKGEKRISGARLYAMPELRPIRLRAGALGQDRPDGDLVVSPAHRLLVTGAKAQALFNTDEVLVSARDLVNDRSVVRDLKLTSVTYVHLFLPRHEVVFANGLETESFHPAGEALDSVEEAERARLIAMMPGLDADPMAYGDYARRSLSRAEAAILASPHA
jgi:Hint domain